MDWGRREEFASEMSKKPQKEEMERDRRIRRAKMWEKHGIGQPAWEEEVPDGVAKADAEALSHVKTHGELPRFYIDRVFICRDCGSEELWTAEQQEWWYEEAKAHIDAVAVRCRDCRKKAKEKGG